MGQTQLFKKELEFPEGFEYYPDFISEKEEQQLLEEISRHPLHPMIFQGYEAKRKVASFGYDYSFDNRKLTKGHNIPDAFNPFIQKVSGFMHIPEQEIAELLITYYPIGSVINWHRDAPPFDLIAGISLLSDCKFKLRPHDKAKQSRKSVVTIPVARRSLYIMKGESRFDWQHSIAPVEAERYSITLRTLKKN